MRVLKRGDLYMLVTGNRQKIIPCPTIVFHKQWEAVTPTYVGFICTCCPNC
jgi:hypothetical protein